MSTTTIPEFRNLVGGTLVDGVDGAWRDVLNPATGALAGRVPEGTQADVDRAVAAAAAARIGWRDTTPMERMEHLLALAAALDAHAPELAALESLNVGKPMSLALEEMPICADELRFYATRRARASTARATRRSCAASRWGSSARSRRGTTR
jgi:acyl-CoA reductase-like NAD-dependent aldehyde dehydrogenase